MLFEMQVLIGLHILFGSIFLGVNIYLDFILTPALSEILPGQAARFSDRVGSRVFLIMFVSLSGLGITGFWMLWRMGMLPALADPGFYITSYGAALSVMMFIWLTTMTTALLLQYWLRPMFLSRMPLTVDKETIEAAREAGIEAGNRMGLLARYNAVAALVAILTGGFLRYGGYW
jgi:hypothetical protein